MDGYSLIIFSGILVLTSGYAIVQFLTKIHHVTFSDDTLNQAPPLKNSLQNKNILLVNTQKKFGGGEIYSLNLYKNFKKHGFNALILIRKNSWLEKELIAHKLPYVALRTFSIHFASNLYHICKNHRIDIMHCNIARELNPAKKVSEQLPVSVVFTKHIPNPYPPLMMKGLDGLIAVSTHIKQEMKQKNKQQDLHISIISCIPPFFNEEQFLSFKPSRNKKEFFKKSFNIKLQEHPIICNIQNMSRDKNQQLLIRAIHKLLYEKGKATQLFIGGIGRQMPRLRALAKKLQVAHCTYFLGHISCGPELLYFSDVSVLPSKREGLGIVALEAALMKKPLIGSHNTGVTNVILHKQTGLTFENGNEQDLADAIAWILDNPTQAKQYGEEAYKHVRQHFSTQSNMKKLHTFYAKVLSSHSSTSSTS